MNHTRIFKILTVLFAVVLCFGPVGLAEPLGTAFTYQGRLIDANKAADGLYDFQFKLFDANSAGNKLGTDINKPEVDVIDGYFTVTLDFNDANAFNGDDRWLDIGVRPGDQSDPNIYTALSPRQVITPTPYALYAASGAGVSVPLELSGSVASPAAVINANNTGTGLGVIGKHNGSGNCGYLGGLYGAYGKHNSSGNYGSLGTNSYGVYGYNSSGNYGSLGTSSYGVLGSSTSGYGVQGSSTDGIGVYGSSTNSDGVRGSTSSNGGTGVYGENETSGNYGSLGTRLYGVYGTSTSSSGVRGSSTSGPGVSGINGGGNYGSLGTSLYGVYGSSSSYGVYGSSTSGLGVSGTSSTGTGVYAYSTSGIGVEARSTSGTGVYGENEPTGNSGELGTGLFGVSGTSTSGIGVRGSSTSGFGVSGTSSSGYAGYFNGNVYVTKDVSADSFTDRTPYPKDLATAYQAVMSMERLPDGQYQENNKENQLDHSKLSDFIRSTDGHRDLSATVSCQNEVIKDLVKQNKELRKRIEALEQKPAERMVK